MSAPRAHPLNGGYDQSLLAETPEVSKAAKQEGYNVTLLDEPPIRVIQGSHITDPPTGVPKEHYRAIGPSAGVRAKVPFWRTRNGMIGLAILAIVVVGAVVGGAVGGTVGKPAKKEAAAAAGIASATTTSKAGTQSQPPQAPVGPSGSSSAPASTTSG